MNSSAPPFASAPTSCCRGTAVPTTWPGSTEPHSHERVSELVEAGERSMRALVDTVDTQRVVMPEQPALTNVNTAAELTEVPPQIA